MQVTNQKLHDYLMNTARTYNTGFFPSEIFMRLSLSEKTDVEMLKFFIEAAKDKDNITYFEGESGPYVAHMDAYYFLVRFEGQVKFDNAANADRLIDEFYALAK